MSVVANVRFDAVRLDFERHNRGAQPHITICQTWVLDRSLASCALCCLNSCFHHTRRAGPAMSSITLDDRDPLIVYSPGWVTGGLPTEYNSTTTYTDGGGATASITFRGMYD